MTESLQGYSPKGKEADGENRGSGKVVSIIEKYQGILPIAKSTSSKNTKIQGMQTLKQGMQNELAVEDISNEKSDLSNQQFALSGIEKVGSSQESALAFERGFEVDNFGSLLGWSLPGHGVTYDDCGKTLVFGCLNVEDHVQNRLDGVDVVGRVFLDLRRRSCGRLECPVCYEKACSKEAHRIDYRLDQWHGSGEVIHVIVSVPKSLWHIPLEDLRSKVYDVVKRVGFFGGSCIVHPFRESCKQCGSPMDSLTERCSNCGCSEFQWVFSPHYHLLGRGWIRGDKVADLYKSEGWIVKNAGIRISVEATAFYQLSHCGVKAGRHSVTWFGSMAYNKLRVVPEVVEKKTCPLCGGDLVSVRWVGIGECPFINEGEYFDRRDNWSMWATTRWRGGG